MAVKQQVNETSFSIELQKSLDKAGDPIYAKKSFGNVRSDADAQNIYDVADAIKAVLAVKTRDTFITISSKLANA